MKRKRRTKRIVEDIATRPAIAPAAVGTQPVHVKLTPTERVILDRLLRNGWFRSRSAALRAGLDLLSDQKKCVTKAEDEQMERERRTHQPRRSYR